MLKPFSVFVLLLSIPLLLAAYSPPEDTAGPLTVEIARPASGPYGAGGNLELTSTDLSIPIEISLKNSAAVPVRGKLRVAVIDGWSVSPNQAVPFEVPAKGESSAHFSAHAPQRTFNAHYPINAYAEFEHEGKTLTAHPVLILETQYPNPPLADPPEWKPVALPAGGAIALWRMPLHGESASIVSRQPIAKGSDSASYEASSPIEFNNRARGSIIMRLGPRAPSMRETVEGAAIEFPLALPAGAAIRLGFAIAASAQTAFRVRVLPFEADKGRQPRIVFDQQRASYVTDHQVDLTDFAGQSIRLAFETESKTPSEAQWVEPVISGGVAKNAASFPPEQDAESKALGNAGDYQVTVWPGRRGILDGSIGFSKGNRKLLFHGLPARVLGDALEDARSTCAFLGVAEESAKSRYRLRHKFESWAGRFDLLSELWVDGPALRARVWLENTPEPRPWQAVYLEQLQLGKWNQNVTRVYAGPGNVIVKPSGFRLPFDGHNLATSFVGFDFEGGISIIEAVDVPPDRLDVDPNHSMATLATPHAQTLTFIPGERVWDGVKAWRELNGLHAAPGVAKLGGRFVFDYWEQAKYKDAAKDLERAFRYGLTDAAVVWHNWQRWGYDYRLPDLFPPNPAGGTLADFAAMVRACKEHGVLFAPHDNYIDFYPDSEGFSYSNILFNPDGTPQKAWFHYARQAQSYRARPDRVQPFVERNVKLIKDGFAPTAYFIDVWSSIAPMDYWTQDGRFMDRISTRAAWGSAFDWIRNYLGGAPQISEAGHDQLIGHLDGAQANHLRIEAKGGPGYSFTWRISAGDSERIPWFDAAHHDRFVLHGAGYPDRYAAGLPAETHGIYSDDYIATEVLTGRPAMVADLFSRDVVRKYWLLHDLMRALSLKKLDAFEFADNIHRQHVRWEQGGDVSVNRGDQDWTASEHVLPQYGYYARVPLKQGAVESAVERKDGKTFEWSRSPSSIYVNGRGNSVSVAGVTTSGGARVTYEASTLTVTPLPSSGRFTVALAVARLPWKVGKPSNIEAVNEQGKVLRSIPISKGGDVVTVSCEPDVFAYRLRAKS